jgi:predicted Zn finger-like uncharacterized protein
MAFAVICKSCQARFLLNDDLLRRKVAGKVVTVRCRQCHATIEVDASDVDPKKLAEVERSSAPIAAPPPIPAPPAPEPLKAKGVRPAPAPPRPAAKSTLMGIGAPRPLGATELVALSPGLMNMGSAAQAVPIAPQGFPEPPPPPGTVEVLDSDDWEIAETPALGQVEPAPESVDDFIEELPPSIAPEEEPPSSTGTPSLKALTHHDEHASEPRVDDFLANMSAAMNGGIMLGAPTIDVSHLAPAENDAAPDVDMSGFDVPIGGKKTLPLFGVDDDATTISTPPISHTTSKTQPIAPAPAPPHAPPATESLSPTAVEPRPPTSQRSDEPRSRKNVVAPTTNSVPPAAAPARQRSSLAGPLLVALAAAAGFLIWKRAAAPQASEPVARAEQATPREAAPAAVPPAVAPTVPPVEPAAVAVNSTAEPTEELTFETAKATPAAAPVGRPSSPSERSAPAARPQPEARPQDAKVEPAAPAAKDEPKPEPAPAREPAAEPSGPFDRSAATASLTSSAAQASACRKEGDPSGVASVIVTFAPSGRVTSANISGPPFAGTATGGCIAAALRKARVPAFEGDRVTVSKTVVIQ